MDNHFWLIVIENSTVSASLISSESSKCDVVSIGPKIKWEIEDADSMFSSVDQSLSIASQSVNLPISLEPANVSFITPPDWVGPDGEILPGYKKILVNLNKKLKLKPMGFIACDEAIIEYQNFKDTSFILLHVYNDGFFCSFVYFGKIVNRITKKYSETFRPEFLEAILIESKVESALPPQIIVFGDTNGLTEEALKNYPWIGKKNTETFLHSPSIQVLGEKEVINIFARFIIHHLHSKLSINEEETPGENTIEPAIITYKKVEEVEPKDIGFDTNIRNIAPHLEKTVIPETSEIPLVKPKLRIKFPSINFKLRPFLYFLALSPIFILFPLFFSHADIDLFVNPYVFSQKTNIVLDPSVNQIDIQKHIIPVIRKTIPVTTSLDTKTTGQKIIGEKAKGEITIYNKSEKTQNISKGAVLMDKSGKKFDITNSVSISPSVSNLEEGIINLGRTKIAVIAQDIGPEYNIIKGTTLSFKEISENILISKVNEPFTGGSKRDVNAVSSDDKKTIEQKIQEKLVVVVQDKINNNLNEDNNIIKESVQSKTSRIEYNREVGEEADELKAEINATVSFLVLSEITKNDVILSFLSLDENFDKAIIDSKKLILDIKISKNNPEQSLGTAEIKGNALPKIDHANLQKKLAGKSKSEAEKIIKDKIPRTYKIIIKHRFPFLTFFNLLPFRQENINIKTATEAL